MRTPSSLCLIFVLLNALVFLKAENPEPITIGAVYYVTGQQATLDQSSVQGAQLAEKKANVLGHPIDIVFLNGESDAEVITTIVDEFIEEHPTLPALFGISDTDLARAAGRAAAKHKRLFLTSGATSPKLPSEVPTYLYLACFGDNVQAAAGAQWAYDNLGARKVAVVFDPKYSYTRLLHTYFQEAFKGLGGEIVSVTPMEGGDIRIPTKEIADCDLIFLSTEATNEAVWGVKALREAGFKQPILGGDGYDTPTVWAKNPEYSDVYYSTHAFISLDNPNPRVQAFCTAYMAEFDGLKPDSFSALAFDSVGLLVEAIKMAGSSEPEAVSEAFGKIENYEGVTGTISYVDGSHIPKKTVSILTVNKGEVTLVEEVMPKDVPAP